MPDGRPLPLRALSGGLVRAAGDTHEVYQHERGRCRREGWRPGRLRAQSLEEAAKPILEGRLGQQRCYGLDQRRGSLHASRRAAVAEGAVGAQVPEIARIDKNPHTVDRSVGLETLRWKQRGLTRVQRNQSGFEKESRADVLVVLQAEWADADWGLTQVRVDTRGKYLWTWRKRPFVRGVDRPGENNSSASTGTQDRSVFIRVRDETYRETLSRMSRPGKVAAVSGSGRRRRGQVLRAETPKPPSCPADPTFEVASSSLC